MTLCIWPIQSASSIIAYSVALFQKKKKKIHEPIKSNKGEPDPLDGVRERIAPDGTGKDHLKINK